MALQYDYLPIQFDREPLFDDERACHGTMFVSRAALDAAKRTPWKFHNARMIQEAIETPSVVFRGLLRKEFEDGYCYCYSPKRRFTDSGKAAAIPCEWVFLVFFKKLNGFVAFDWEFRLEHRGRHGWPRNWQVDFKETMYGEETENSD